MTTRRENYLRAVRFERPEVIPVHFHVNEACWHHYPQEALKELLATHPMLFPDYEKPEGKVEPTYLPWQRAGEPFTDSWGCVWETTDDGITGSVIRHPLETWDAFEGYTPPDPEHDFGWGSVDWRIEAERIRKQKADGRLATGGLPHGHTFMRLMYIRGYENLLYDMTDDDPRLARLIDTVETLNLSVVRRYIAYGAELMGYPEDLGMQQGPMLSPEQFHRYIKPSYERLMAPAREAGCIVHMHSDGDIRTLIDDLAESGVEVINLQDLVNGIDWIAGRLAGRICIDLDVDRQRITRFGTPAEVDALIREEVAKLGSREGGLMFTAGIYPGIPLDNIRALMDALEKYATYYS